MKSLVLDASVTLKWVLSSEQDSDIACRIQQSLRNSLVAVTVPSLWVYEVGNFWARTEPKAGKAIFENLLASGVTVMLPDLEMRNLAFALATKYGVTFYDSSYHALALRSESLFVTADDRYYRKAKGAGNICLLHDYERPQL